MSLLAKVKDVFVGCVDLLLSLLDVSVFVFRALALDSVGHFGYDFLDRYDLWTVK